MAPQTRSLLNKKAVRDFIRGNGKYITQVESTFYILLEQRLRSTILKAIRNNASRHRLSQYELSGNNSISNEFKIKNQSLKQGERG